jgi:hypothetical protein
MLRPCLALLACAASLPAAVYWVEPEQRLTDTWVDIRLRPEVVGSVSRIHHESSDSTEEVDSRLGFGASLQVVGGTFLSPHVGVHAGLGAVYRGYHFGDDVEGAGLYQAGGLSLFAGPAFRWTRLHVEIPLFVEIGRGSSNRDAIGEDFERGPYMAAGFGVLNYWVYPNGITAGFEIGLRYMEGQDTRVVGALRDEETFYGWGFHGALMLGYRL